MAAEGATLLRTILNRIKEIEGKETDAAVAPFLKASTARLEQWKNRDTIPWERLVEYSREYQVSLEWLVNGHGPPRRAQLGVAEPGAIYRVATDQDAVYNLAAVIHMQSPKLSAGKYQELLRLLHREMLETGKTPPPEKIEQLLKLVQ